MSKIKNWLCPQCPQDSSRHWNLMVHIRREHCGIGQPIRKGTLIQERNLIRTHINRSAYPNPNHSSGNSVNYSKQAIGRDGDIINETHRFFTDMEEKRRKLEEIIEITHKYLTVPSQHTDSSVISVKDIMRISHPNTLCHDKPHPEASIQPYITPNEITSKKTRREKSSEDTPTTPKGETKSPSNEGDVSRPANVRWVHKLDMFGNVVDCYRVVIDPIEELRDFVKECEKSNMLYQ